MCEMIFKTPNRMILSPNDLMNTEKTEELSVFLNLKQQIPQINIELREEEIPYDKKVLMEKAYQKYIFFINSIVK
jgi:hypothetical protein